MQPTPLTPAILPRARLAGALYLVIILCGVWSEGVARAALIDHGDAAQTAVNILAGEALFRRALAADAVMALSDVALAALLFALLAPVHRGVARMAMLFRLVQAAILGANLLNLQAALLVLKVGAPGAPDWALLFLDLHRHGYDLGLLFFGINCLLTGWLICRSGFLPRLLGAGLTGSGLVYLAGSALRFLAPGLSEGFAPAYLLPLMAESALCLWLLIRGVDARKWG
ncbi:DUF4386 domain-containing protein [Actibacterium sp. MT2.3-13A]|uniref:DUF4386 domain-containing protein n=1 Tax=Actibacterium sp. MT2.3-13A TaxID=2828332 RepID=UPI001BA50BF5|nr:DUF4386 domain-containing protein [Actibacterium sp. MT2.3-13A]